MSPPVNTVLVDGQGGTWEPSTLTPDTWDLVDVQGQEVSYPLSGWARQEIEATWPPIWEVEEPARKVS